jgi:hypothetical protein
MTEISKGWITQREERWTEERLREKNVKYTQFKYFKRLWRRIDGASVGTSINFYYMLSENKY